MAMKDFKTFLMNEKMKLSDDTNIEVKLDINTYYDAKGMQDLIYNSAFTNKYASFSIDNIDPHRGESDSFMITGDFSLGKKYTDKEMNDELYNMFSVAIKDVNDELEIENLEVTIV